jgi:tetratricopeptide (TPR) repeat protein
MTGSFIPDIAGEIKNKLLLIFFFMGVCFYTTFGRNQESDTSLISGYILKAGNSSADSSFYYSGKAAELAGKFLDGSQKDEKVRRRIIRLLISAELNTGLHYYQNIEYDKTLEHYNTAYRWAKEINEPFYLAECLFNFAELDIEQSKYSLAMTHYFGALQEYQRAGDKSGIYWCYTGMGIAQKQCGNFSDAIICYEKALAITSQESMKIEAAYCYNNLGNVYRKQGNFPKAMDSFEKAISCFLEMKEELSASDCLNNIGNLYMDNGDPFRALDYYNRSVQIEAVQKDNYRLVSRYKNLADAYFTLKDFTNATMFLDKALNLAERTNDKSLLASCYSQVGNIHVHKGSAETGILYLKKASDMFESIGAKAEQAETLVELAGAELSAGRIDESFGHARAGEQLSRSIGALKTLANANECLAKIWEQKGNTGKSLQYLKNVIQFRDSIFSAEKNRSIEEIEAGFTRTKLEYENQILLQNSELQNQALKIRNIALVSIVLCFLLFLIVFWLIIKRHQDAKSLAIIKQAEIVKLNENLLLKERELTTKTVYITQKNSLLKNLIDELEALSAEPDTLKNRIGVLQRELKKEISPDSWKEFEIQFNDVHPGFQERLLERFHDLTPAERRLCSFLRLNMNTREIISLTEYVKTRGSIFKNSLIPGRVGLSSFRPNTPIVKSSVGSSIAMGTERNGIVQITRIIAPFKIESE